MSNKRGQQLYLMNGVESPNKKIVNTSEPKEFVKNNIHILRRLQEGAMPFSAYLTGTAQGGGTYATV